MTRFASISDFDVLGKRVIADPNTKLVILRPDGSHSTQMSTNTPIEKIELRVGQSVDVFGSTDRKKRAIRAAELWVDAPGSRSVSGMAVIEAMLPMNGTPPGTVAFLKADGYRIRIEAGTKMKFGLPLTSTADIGPNVVMKYEGSQELDGLVVANAAEFYQNIVTDAEMEQREEWNYDPHLIAQGSRQSVGSKILRGADPMAFPLYQDSAMQARVSAVGERLIPAYQKALPADERARMTFRFYVVDARRGLWALPGGMILVSPDLVARTQNDSQLAALLAQAIAHLIERQPFGLPLTNRQIAKMIGFDAAVDLIPYAALAYTPFAVHEIISGSERVHLFEEQRERVALSLLHDAGFDLMEAPKMEWILASKKPKDISKVPPSRSALYMYGVLGTTWAGEQGPQPDKP